MMFLVWIFITFLLKSSQGTILSENLIDKNGPSDHVTLDDVDDDNDSTNENNKKKSIQQWCKVFGTV
jgi:hypothetical protein